MKTMRFLMSMLLALAFMSTAQAQQAQDEGDSMPYALTGSVTANVAAASSDEYDLVADLVHVSSDESSGGDYALIVYPIGAGTMGSTGETKQRFNIHLPTLVK